jgi:hypothetical protein
MKKTLIAIAVASTLLLPAGTALAQAEAKPSVVSPFDKDDPEIQRLRSLNWKAINFDAEDLETRTIALLAMQHVLSMMGSKASARLELLVDYIDQNKLGEAFVAKQQATTLPPLVSYDEAKKVSVAFVKSNVGKDKFGDELTGSDDATLKAYLQMYTNSSRRAFDECIEARTQVRAIALFLQSSGKFDEFKSWAKDERKRKQAARDQETAKVREEDKVRLEQEKEARQAEQKASQQMELFMTQAQPQPQPQQQPPSGDQTVIYQIEDDWDGDTWWPGTGAYYATDAYRGYVRDKFQDRWQDWNNRPRPTPRRGGGGRRR